MNSLPVSFSAPLTRRSFARSLDMFSLPCNEVGCAFSLLSPESDIVTACYDVACAISQFSSFISLQRIRCACGGVGLFGPLIIRRQVMFSRVGRRRLGFS